MDATVIELCLSVFDWAKFRKTKGALKIHCLLDHRGNIPSFAVVTEGRRHDVKVAKEVSLPLVPDSILAVDRGYLDFTFLHSIHEAGCFFVTRAKENMAFDATGQHKMPNKKGLIEDMAIQLKGKSLEAYPEELRYIIWHDEETDKYYSFLTNNFKLAASTIAAIYKSRWQIESFFKWVKQNLKIKTFLGTSYNAVMIQIWVAMCYFLLLAFIKYQTCYRYSLLSLSRVVKETLMDRVSLVDLLSLNPDKGIPRIRDATPQLSLF
jgi:transposase